MTESGKEIRCAYCGEALGSNPVRRGNKVYCCEACAHEAQRAVDCGGRTDSARSSAIVEPVSRDK